jgi:8-oxo-dGTP pyrophosphatase MutT (NUDIX family)
LICAPAERSVLLTLHARIGRWLQTGGHLEPGDTTLAAAALREAREESGLVDLTLDPVPLLLSRHLLDCRGVGLCFHLDVQYLVRTAYASAPVVSAESDAVQWFAFDRLPEVDASVQGLVGAAAARLRW